MAAGIGLVVKIAADTAKAVGDIKDVNQALDGTGKSTGSASKMFDGLKSAALPVIGAVVAGVGAAAAAMVTFAQAAWEDQQEAKKLARVLETIPGITQDMIDANEGWVTSTMFATHVLDTDLREAVGSLTLVTGNLAEAQAYAARSADLATVANVDYKTATEAVEKALTGKTRQLMAMAPWLDTNKDGTLSLAEAQAILTSNTLEGQAAAAAAEDPWTTIKLIWDEIQEALGGALLPIMEKVADWFKSPANQQKVKEFIDKIANLATQVGQKLVPAFESLIEYLSSPEFTARMRVTGEIFAGIFRVVSTVTKAVGDFIAMLGRIPHNITSFDLGSPSNKSGGTASAGTFAATSTGVTVNFYGGIHTDPEATARAISSSLRASDRRNARTRNLEPAW